MQARNDAVRMRKTTNGLNVVKKVVMHAAVCRNVVRMRKTMQSAATPYALIVANKLKILSRCMQYVIISYTVPLK